MRRSIYAFVLAGLLLVLAGCGTTPSESGQQGTESISSIESAVAGEDLSVHLEETLDLTGKEVQLTYSMSNRMEPCETLAALGEESTEVVQGKIVAVDYFHVETMPYTKVDIMIQESLKGELQAGDTISAYKLGGYIQLKDSDPDIQVRYPNITDDEMENTVFDYRIDGDPHPSVGQEGVFFLKPKVGDMPEGLYLITDGYDGQFIKRPDGNYARHFDGNASFSEEEGLVGYSLEDPYAAYETDRADQQGMNAVLTYEQIKIGLNE